MDSERIRSLGLVLRNCRCPLKQRFRALFTLKNFGDVLSVKCIAKCFDDQSALFKHELAYCLGQMQNSSAVPYLIEVLEDQIQEIIVRHEAAEALGAIGDEVAVPVLEKYKQCEIVELSETCELSLKRLNYYSNGGSHFPNVYGSIDPAPPSDEQDIINLQRIYLNEKENIFERYRALFALRNFNTDESISIICQGFRSNSTLFRHEVAFVLGQLQNVASIPALIEVATNLQENNMVRHEAIEALGSIGLPECTKIIQNFLNDEDQLIRESCEVALDIHSHQNSSEFQYANGLEMLSC